MKVYLDNCCFNRPYDDQRFSVIKLEAEAKLYIQDMIKDGKLELVWSFMMDYENSANPITERRERIMTWRDVAKINIVNSDIIKSNAEEYKKLGLHTKDAYHLSCAVFAGTDYFITTDKKILNKPITGIKLVNPYDFLWRFYNEQ